jgi:acetyl-CoA C-acetyltransferase
MGNIVIVSGKRTAVGSFGGSLKGVAAKDLGALVMRETLLSIGLRPEMPAHTQEEGPDALKGSGLAPIEKDYLSGRKRTPVAIDGSSWQRAPGRPGSEPGRQAISGPASPRNHRHQRQQAAPRHKVQSPAAAPTKAGDNEISWPAAWRT